MGNDITLPTDPGYPVPADTSSSGGGSATSSAPASPLPGLTVTDKDGQRISYTSTQSGNTLTVCVGRLTASFRISLAALRQLRAEGIETIAFQTILCSTTLSVDERRGLFLFYCTPAEAGTRFSCFSSFLRCSAAAARERS